MGQSATAPRPPRHRKKNRGQCGSESCGLWGGGGDLDETPRDPIAEPRRKAEDEALLPKNKLGGFSTSLQTQLQDMPSADDRWKDAKAQWEARVTAQLEEMERRNAGLETVAETSEPPSGCPTDREEERRQALELLRQELALPKVSPGKFVDLSEPTQSGAVSQGAFVDSSDMKSHMEKSDLLGVDAMNVPDLLSADITQVSDSNTERGPQEPVKVIEASTAWLNGEVAEEGIEAQDPIKPSLQAKE